MNPGVSAQESPNLKEACRSTVRDQNHGNVSDVRNNNPANNPSLTCAVADSIHFVSFGTKQSGKNRPLNITHGRIDRQVEQPWMGRCVEVQETDNEENTDAKQNAEAQAHESESQC